MLVNILSTVFFLLIFYVFTFIWEAKWPNDSKVIAITRKGVLIFFIIITFFAFLFYQTNCIKLKDNLASFSDCVYFSLITFATIGYGDLIPTCENAKNIILLETIFSLVFIPIFGGYLFNQILKNRPQNIILPKSLQILCDNEKKVRIEIINNGKPTVSNRILIEVAIIPVHLPPRINYGENSPYFNLDHSYNIPYFSGAIELLLPYDDENWIKDKFNIFDNFFNANKGADQRDLSKIKNYSFRISYYGQDIETDQNMYASKVYTYSNFVVWS